MIKLGSEEPPVSMDSSQKVIWAKHNDIKTVNLKGLCFLFSFFLFLFFSFLFFSFSLSWGGRANDFTFSSDFSIQLKLTKYTESSHEASLLSLSFIYYSLFLF